MRGIVSVLHTPSEYSVVFAHSHDSPQDCVEGGRVFGGTLRPSVAGIQTESTSIPRMELAAMNRVGSIKAHPLVLNGVALLIGLGLYLLVFK